MGRFDYIKYDETAQAGQLKVKGQCEKLEETLADFPEGRAKNLALTKLEEFYMWVGKAIRDDQIQRGTAAPLQEERGNE